MDKAIRVTGNSEHLLLSANVPDFQGRHLQEVHDSHRRHCGGAYDHSVLGTQVSGDRQVLSGGLGHHLTPAGKNFLFLFCFSLK